MEGGVPWRVRLRVGRVLCCVAAAAAAAVLLGPQLAQSDLRRRGLDPSASG
jgi:hypothetical protein